MDNETRGRHLTVTAFCHASAVAQLNDANFLAALLHESIDAVGMKVLVPAQMVRVPLDRTKRQGPKDCGGVTGVAILSTSHVSIHTWPLHQRVSFDLYSCQDFDADRVLELLKDRLKLTGGEIVTVARGGRPDLRDHFVRQDVSLPL